MKKDKLYLRRKIDQFRGKPLYVEDEIDKYGYHVYLPDTRIERGSTTAIFVEFRDKNGATYAVSCEVVDYEDKLVKFMIPTEILSNEGKYEFVLSVAYRANGTEEEVDRSAIQTFTIVDTIEIDDEQIKQDTNYPLLLELIKEISKYQVDTSAFPTYEEMEQAINEKLQETSMENIVKELNERGFITNDILTKILSNYATYSDLTMYARKSDLNGYVRYTEYYTTRDKVNDLQTSLTNLRGELNNYVLKEEGKGLSTHDLTDELYMKLINGVSGGNGEISDELLQMITDALPRDEASEKYYNKEEVNALLDEIETIISDYYTKEQSDERYIQKGQLTTDGVTYNGVTVTEALDALYNSVPPEILSFTIRGGNIYRAGTSLESITLNWQLGGDVSNVQITGLIDSPITFNVIETSYTYSLNSTTSNRDITLTVSNKRGDTVSKTIPLRFVFPFYYGATTYDTLNASTVSIANSSLIVKGNHTFSITANDARPYIIYFTDYGALKDIKDDNGLSYINCFIEQEVNVGGTIYRGYILDNKIICTDMKFTIYFEEGDE